jgi:hypothetical protein
MTLAESNKLSYTHVLDAVTTSSAAVLTHPH